jgi:hypothetical protein
MSGRQGLEGLADSCSIKESCGPSHPPCQSLKSLPFPLYDLPSCSHCMGAGGRCAMLDGWSAGGYDTG